MSADWHQQPALNFDAPERHRHGLRRALFARGRIPDLFHSDLHSLSAPSSVGSHTKQAPRTDVALRPSLDTRWSSVRGVKWTISVLILCCIPLYQFWKFAGALPGFDATHHVFTPRAELEIVAPGGSVASSRGLKSPKPSRRKKDSCSIAKGTLATFVPARHLEGPVEAELVRKFIRHNVADAQLLA